MRHLDGYKQLIHTPTRVTLTTRSSLDHIICNYDDKISQYGVITSGVCDHCFTYCTRKSTKVIYNKHKCVNVRLMKNYSKESFTDKLSDIDWSEVTLSDDVNKAWSTYTCLFMDTINSVAPLKEVRIKQRSESWTSSDILDNIRQWLNSYGLRVGKPTGTRAEGAPTGSPFTLVFQLRLPFQKGAPFQQLWKRC